ncbi:succinylglutamate desuccinylase [Paraglaciecola sp. 2405UD69-4]|uniref:succinylglutamate desuccinylase n=1 Tax=Paraglaciecola sp. 2405UD69-4 TaxID=3391836 RepID=UPI0039C9E33C
MTLKPSSYNPSEIINQVLLNGEFLSLSRTQPALFSKPLDFNLLKHTQVHILAEGIICFEPENVSDKDLVLSCGIHGNETAPIEICDALVKDILLGKIIVKQRLLVIFGNLPAMDIAKRFVIENMNRLFSGEHQNLNEGQSDNAERRRAHQLEQAVKQFYLGRSEDSKSCRYHYDLHTAIRPSKNQKFAVYPFQHDKPWDKQQLQILLACGVNTILLSGSPTTTFSYYSANEFEAHAFTVELGKVQAFGENDMSNFKDVITTLTKMICAQDLALKAYDESDFLIYEVNQVINKHQTDFKLNFTDDVPNFSDFSKGEILATESGKTYFAEYDGEAVVFPNANVEIGQRAVLTVIPTSI